MALLLCSVPGVRRVLDGIVGAVVFVLLLHLAVGSQEYVLMTYEIEGGRLWSYSASKRGCEEWQFDVAAYGSVKTDTPWGELTVIRVMCDENT